MVFLEGGGAQPNLSVDLKLWQMLHFVRKKRGQEVMSAPGPLEAPLWSSESNERVTPTYSSSYSGLQGPLQTYSQKKGGEETERTCPWRTIDGDTGKEDKSLHVGCQGRGPHHFRVVMQWQSQPWKGSNYVVTAQWKETAWACGRLASQEHGEVFWLKVGVLVGQGRGKPLPVRGLWLQQHSRRCSRFQRSLGK